MKTISSLNVYKGAVIDVHVDTLKDDDGTYFNRETVKVADGVVVVAKNEGKFAMVRQYRHSVRAEILEFPAGRIDPGERPLVAAIRELREEVGCISKWMWGVGSFWASPGYSSEKLHTFFTQDFDQGNQDLDEGEELSVEWVTDSEIERMIEYGEIEDAKTIVAYHMIKSKFLD